MKKISVIKSTIELFSNSSVMTLAAALSFYTSLSLAPLLLIAVTLLDFLGLNSQIQLVAEIRSVMGQYAADAFGLILKNINSDLSDSQAPGIIGLIILFFSASKVFSQLQISMNTIWSGREETPKMSIWTWLQTRLISFGLVASFVFLTLVSLLLSALLNYVFTQTESLLFNIINFLFTFLIFTMSFTFMFKAIPDHRSCWWSSFRGGIMTSILFVAGKELIGFYLSNTNLATAYGAAGSLIFFLIWIYYASIIVLSGACLTRALQKEYLL